MAATVSSPWSKPGAWALDAEEHEAELQEQPPEKTDLSSEQYPSLSAAASKPKKKKGQTLSLAEFTKQPTQPSRHTNDEILVLPTGPRQRSPEELSGARLGGGFKNYGGNRYGSSGDDSSNSNGRWGSSRVSNRESSRELPPSRADEIDNWAAAKKSTGSSNGFGSGFDRRERGERGGFFDSQSKADEADSWVSNKSSNTVTNTSEPPRRFGGGFERRSSFDSLQSRERDLDNWGKKKEDSGSASVSGGVRPRLMLQPRTVPLSDEGKKEAAAARPKGANPFGEARPREQVLAEKGKDWKEIDEKLEAVKIKEAPAAVTGRAEKGFGFGNGRAPPERSWRRNEAASVQPQSAESTENGDGVESAQ